MPRMADYYHILGVQPHCRFPELKKAYYRQAMACHPDRFSGNPAKAEAFKQLVEAFNVLSDPLTRAAYDARRAARDPAAAGTSASVYAYKHEHAILDTFADDILEEMIVGNTIPHNTSLQTLMLDLGRTERFCLFREAKTCFYNGDIAMAADLFRRYAALAPLNILAHYYLGRCQILRKNYRHAAKEYAEALRIGTRRRPPLNLPRIRHELDILRRTRLGLLSRAAAWWKNESSQMPPLPPDEQMRREVTRAMHNLLRNEQRRRTQLPNPNAESSNRWN